jgi:hypothetical protein
MKVFILERLDRPLTQLLIPGSIIVNNVDIMAAVQALATRISTLKAMNASLSLLIATQSSLIKVFLQILILVGWHGVPNFNKINIIL